MADRKRSPAGPGAPDDGPVPAGDAGPVDCMSSEEPQPALTPPARSRIPPQHYQPDPPVLVAATRRAFATAAAQYNSLTLLGAAAAGPVVVGDMVKPDRARARSDAFLKDGLVSINQYGGLNDFRDYALAVAAIQAKAAALGYGAQSTPVPIDFVAGGYVGRYGGNDIYAPAG